MTLRVTVSMEPETKKMLEDIAREERSTVSGVIKALAKQSMEQRDGARNSQVSFSELIKGFSPDPQLLKSPAYKKYEKTGRAKDLAGLILEEKALGKRSNRRRQ